ncbi:unnamed protein product [Lampetra fluviatilis]
MSVCDSFTEHAWIKGKCQDCFRPRDQHRGGPANQAAGGGHAAPANAEKTRPPVAKKPASFRAPAAPAQVGNGDGEVGRDARQAEGGRGAHAVTGWRKGADDGALDRKRSNNNNHHFGVRHARFECKEAAADFGSACDKLENGNNNDNDVFADAAVLANQQLAAGDAAGGCDNSSLALFLNRIRSRYHRSAERGAAAAHGCLASDRKVWRPRKRVRLGEGGPEVISHEGGVFCYADSEASSGSPEEAAGTGGVAAAREEGRESWDESDEELLAIEMRMRDRSRFAELRPNSLSPVHFGRHGGRAARPRNPVLRRDRPHGRDDRPEAERDAAGGADANPDPSEGKASYVSSSEDLETPSPVSAGALCPRQESTSQGLDSQGNTSAEPMEGREQPHRPQQQQQPHRLQQQHMELRCGAQLDVAATRSAAAQEPLSTGEKRLNHAANLLFTLSAVPHTPVYAQSTRSKTFIPPSAAHEENNNNNYYVTPAPPTSESQASRPQRKDSPGERPGREHAQPHGRLGGGGNASPAIFAPNAASPRIGGPALVASIKPPNLPPELPKKRFKGRTAGDEAKLEVLPPPHRAGSSASASPSGFDAGPDASAPRDRRETKGEEGGHEAAGRVQQQQQQQQGLSHTDPLGRRVPRKDRGGGAQRGPRQQQLFKSHSVECSPVHAAFSGDATPERRASPASRGQRPPRSLESTSQDSIPESDDSLADGDGSPFPAPALDAAHAGRGPRQRPGSKPGSADGGGEAVAPAGGVYRNIESAEAVSARILSLQAEATRRLAAKCEQVFMRGCAARVGLREESWPDFKLRSNKPCCEAGDGTYYAATYAKDPDHAYAIKVCKGRADASQRRRQQQSATVTRGVPVHYNIQQECGHFVAEVPPSLLPHGEDADGADPGRLVVIAREAPHRTLADLVRTSAEEHRAEPERYERLASLLLLQLCAALEHLKVHGVTHCGLRLENLLLARSGRPGDPTPRLVLSNFLQAKQQQQQPKNRARHDRGETGAGPPGGPAPPEQLRLAPELLSAAQYRKLDEFQTGILIYEMLHLPNPFEDDPGLRASGYSTDDLPPFLRLSCYSSGLQRLAFQLLQPDPASRLPIAEARVALQLLAWGPQAEHLTRELGGPRPDGRRLREVLRNWLDVRRALLMVVFAEKALAQDGPEGGGVNLEDWLRCQFFAFTTVDCMARAVELLRLC